jgi:hypothetical protein
MIFAICVALACRGSFPGNVRVVVDGHSCTLQRGRTVWQWDGQTRRVQDGLDAACQLSG